MCLFPFRPFLRQSWQLQEADLGLSLKFGPGLVKSCSCHPTCVTHCRDAAQVLPAPAFLLDQVRSCTLTRPPRGPGMLAGSHPAHVLRPSRYPTARRTPSLEGLFSFSLSLSQWYLYQAISFNKMSTPKKSGFLFWPLIANTQKKRLAHLVKAFGE